MIGVKALAKTLEHRWKMRNSSRQGGKSSSLATADRTFSQVNRALLRIKRTPFVTESPPSPRMAGAQPRLTRAIDLIYCSVSEGHRKRLGRVPVKLSRANTGSKRRRLDMRRHPSQARARRTFGTVLDAAVALIEREGVERATTRRIALAAGVSIGAVYEYFPNKESIVLHL
ncbi:MAG TPA: helix-turn-helix domain-containing protein, partial [Steroidobacteraceae bacterium]|nr:helix-turn-helix domain-containing protein [Steroidobacteraceae bacterium]